MPLTPRQIAAGSPQVVVAVVEEARPHWNPRHTFIFTDYSLRIEERLRGDAPERVTLSIPGGTVDGETHGTCVSTPLVPGARYLLFLQDLKGRTLVPVTGGRQGVFREAPGTEGKRFSETVRAARELIARVEAAPEPEDTAWLRAAKPPVGVLRKAGGERPPGAKFVVEHSARAPLVFHPLPPESPFYRVDQQAMAYWNLYAHDLFRVSREPAYDWGFGNGLSEIAGFVTSEDIEQQFGVGWSPDTISATLWRYASADDQHIVEADLAFNPGHDWTLDADAATRGLNKLSFAEWILRDLGTAWGYRGVEEPGQEDQSSVTQDSLMSFEAWGSATPEIFAEDAAAARATYPGAKPIRDGLISSYSLRPTSDFPLYVEIEAAVDSVVAGGGFDFVHPIKIENPGTEPLARPKVEIYLVPARYSFAGAILLKKMGVRGNVRPRGVATFELGRVKVPASTPAGTYYFAFLLRDPRDANQANNLAWSSQWGKIEVTR
jgi:hypothetical protein